MLSFPFTKLAGKRLQKWFSGFSVPEGLLPYISAMTGTGKPAYFLASRVVMFVLIITAYVRYPMLYEPHCLMEKERLFEVAKSLALAYLDVIEGKSPHPDQVVLPGPPLDPNYQISTPERARRLSGK